MDFDLDVAQRARLTHLAKVVESTGGHDRAFAVSVEGGFDAALDGAIGAESELADGDLLDAVLLVHDAARLGLAIDVGTRFVLGRDLPVTIPPGPVGFADLDRRGPVRFGADIASLIVVEGTEARFLTDGFSATDVPSGMSYRYADVGGTSGGAALPDGTAAILRRHRLLALSAEIAGAADAGIEMTAHHLTEREQFGRPLGSFQALRHRLAEAKVSAEALGWLVRSAGYADDPQQIVLAASYAIDTASKVATELTQLCGARAFMREFGLQVFTMRMEAARVGLGNQARIAAEYATTV
jgi:hypothetical protein